MTGKWLHPVNDGSMGIAYRLLDESESNERLSFLLNEMCHVFHDHADGNWASDYKEKYARRLAAEIERFPFLVGRLLGTGDRVICMVTHRALELRGTGGSLAPDMGQP